MVNGKGKVILECFVSLPVAKEALDGTFIADGQIQRYGCKIGNLIKDEDFVDVFPVERYFSAKALNSIIKRVDEMMIVDEMKRKCK